MRIIALATAAALAMPMAPALAQQAGTLIGPSGNAQFPFAVEVNGQTLFCDSDTGDANCISPENLADAGTGTDGGGFFEGGGLNSTTALIAGGVIIGVIIAATGSATNNTN